MSSDLSNRDPPLDDPRSVGGAGVSTVRRVRSRGRVQEGRGGAGWWDGRGCGRAGRGRAQQGGDDTVGDGVELGDGGADGGRQISVFLLVALGPDAAQTVEGHHSDKQFLREDAMTRIHNMNENPTERPRGDLMYLLVKPTASNLVSCSATSLTGKSMKLHLSSSFSDVSPSSSWFLFSCRSDPLLCCDADRLQSVKHAKS